MADNTQFGPLQPKQQTASDIRKVVANATKTTGKGYTIANNEELNKQKADKENKPVKVNKTTTANKGTPKTNTVNTNTNNVVSKQAPVGPVASPVVSASQLTSDIFKNPQLQPITNVPIYQQDNQAQNNIKGGNRTEVDTFINNTTRAEGLKAPIDVDNAVMDLFNDVKTKYKDGSLSNPNLEALKQGYSEFSNMNDDALLALVGTLASLVRAGLPLNDNNMKTLKSKFPELTSASWGFDVGGGENMYQAGGMREQLSAGSKTDLNKYGTAGMVAEGIMNPLGEVATLTDMGVQMIPQADNNNSREQALRNRLQSLTDDDIKKYKKEYDRYVKENGTLSKLYTTQLEGDTVVEQLWNWVSGKGKQDSDAGFRSWLIDRINNEENGWFGEFIGAGNELKGVGGPNIAKMYANIPASTAKTVSAVARAITNPIDTAAGLYSLAFTEEGHQALAARYGSWEAFAKALEQDPVGVSSDALAVVEGGAGATKLAAGTAAKGSLLAALTTETLGGVRASEGLLKLASRLEYLATKAEGVEKLAGLSSNLGADIGLKGGQLRLGKNQIVVNGLVNGLKKWGESGDSLLQKAAKYTAKASEKGVGEYLKDATEIAKKGPINSLADMLMGSATDSDKLFKAASPNINRLSNNVDYKNKRAKMDLAEQAIVDAGYLPKSISEWAKAHTETLNKKWNEFKQLVEDKADVMVDVKDILEDVKNYIKSEREGATELQKQDLRKLEVEVGALERMGKVDMNFIEKRKEHYNSSWRDSDKLKVGDVYLRGLKLIGNAMRKQQDNILGKGPESTKKLRKEIAALMDTKNDVIKADLRNQKKKSDISGGGLVESYGRLSGLGDVIGGVVGGVLGKGGEGFAQAGKGIGKMVLGKAMGRAKDVDYLTQKGFEGLSKKKGLGTNKDGGLRDKIKDRRELGDLLVEKDKLKKELKNDKLSKEERTKLEERYDDVEYAIAQKKARSGLGDKEEELNAESKKKVIDMVQKRANDVGFTTKVADDMGKNTQGYTDLRKKLIALEKNPGDTTAQHELFHAFFSVVDDKTKTYILDEAKKILKDSGMADKNAEEWLAESFGIYAKRKQIKLGLIDAPKGFVAKVRDFFQRVYEFMQRFNGDRATINKLFDEVLGDRQMKNGIMDLSELLGDKEVKSRKLYSEMGDNGLRKKSVYHGSPADFDKFDSSHMGEGEGAQAHGWGHYVAVEEGTAGGYARKLNRATYKGQPIEFWEKRVNDGNRKNLDDVVVYHVLNDIEGNFDGTTVSDAINDAKDHYKKQIRYANSHYKQAGYDNVKEYKKRWQDFYDAADKLKEEDFSKHNRNLYTLDIPDPVKADTPTGKNYIEEDEKIGKSALNKMVDWFKKDGWEVEDSYGNVNVSKGGVEFGLGDGTDTWKYIIQNEISNPKAFSQTLNKMGYDGIHYFGGRDGEAYVIFNDDALKIKDHIRYKKKTDSEGRELSDRQLKYFGNSKVRNDKGELVPVYHFTADDFNTVDFKKGAQNYFWFTSDKNASDRAMGVRPGMEKKRKDMYVDIKNPAGWDEYNKFGTDELKARGYDGVILKEKDGSFEGFIWDKENQVKYVYNQNPTRASKDMRFKKEFSLKEKDAEYEKAVKEGDTEKALGLLRKEAEKKGYKKTEDYKGRGAWSAPSSSVERADFRNTDEIIKRFEEDGDNVNLYTMGKGYNPIGEGMLDHGAEYRYWRSNDGTSENSFRIIRNALDDMERQMKEYGEIKNMPEIEVYRAVPDYKKKWNKLQKDIDVFTFDEEGNPRLINVDKLSKESQDDFYRYSRQYREGIIKESPVKYLYDSLKGSQEIADDWSIKEGMFESGGEWVTPSKRYAQNHGRNRFDGNYNVISEKVPADELWWDGNDINEWGFDDGKDYVVKKGAKNSRKNIEITYDNKGKLIPLEKRFDENKRDVRFKKKTDDDRMVALHNTSLEKLNKSNELGGLVAPSVALTKKGIPFENYGEISFIGNKDLVTPSRDVQVGETDLYSPRVPQPTLEWKEGVTRAQQEKIAEKFGMKMGELHDYIDGYSQNYYERTYPGLDKAVAPLIKKSLFKGFTEMGDRIYKPYDMKHILQEMFSEGTEGAESGIFQGTFNEAMARLSNDAKSLEDVRDKIGNKAGLEEKYKALEDKYTDKAWDLLDGDRGMAIFSENIKKSVPEITSELNKYDIDVTEKQVQQLKNLVEKGLKLPKSYVEAKIKRGVGFDEFSAVVVPENKVAEVKKIVGDKIDVYGYKEGERMKVIDKVADDNGLRFKKAYHGTSAKFDKFDSSHMSEGEGNQAHGWGHYVAVEPETAKKYAGLKEKNAGGVFYNIDGKTYKEVYNSLSPFEKDAYDSFIALRNNDYDFEEAWDRIKKDKTEEINNGIKDMKAAIEYGKKYLLEEKLTPEQKERIKSFLESDKKHLEDYEKQKKELHKIDELKARSDAGNYMYELDIPDPVKKDTPTGSNYLEEEGKVDKKVVDVVVEKLRESGLTDAQKDKLFDNFGYFEEGNGKVLYNRISRVLGSDKQASKFLESLGYDGIHYFGGQDGEAYVLFNDNSPKIKNALRYKKAYHGGGDFDKFDLSHAGEGEGNTAHGWGVYVTENQARAKEYGNLYRNNKYGLGLWGGNGQFVTYKGKKLPELNGENSSLIGQIIQGMQNRNDANPYYSAESQIARVKRGLLDQQNVWQLRGLTDKSTKEILEKEIKFLEGLDPKDFKIEDAKRNLYEVDIPNMKKANTPTGINYIEEEGLITHEAYREINKKLFNETGKRMFSWSPSINGKKLYERLTNVLGSEKQASEFLKDMGYDGIHYIGKEDGSSYVLFDDKTPQIKNTIRYKKGLTAKDQTQTPEFKKWFEGSKVVDKSGKPLVAYHGTHGDFTIFDKEKIGSNTNNEGLFGKGFYFTTDSKYGDYYKGKGWSKDRLEGKTMQVYLDIKNPFMWNDYKGPQAIEKLRKELGLPKSVLEWNNYGDNGIHVFTKPEQSRRFTEALEKAGYDGVWFKYDNGTQDEIVAFNPNQIKSATDNIGTFDKNNPDIRYKKGLQKKGNGLHKKTNASILAKGRDRK